MATRTRNNSNSMLSKRTKSTRDGVKRGITVGESFVLTDGQPVWVTDGVKGVPHAAIVVQSPTKKKPKEVQVKWTTTLVKETVQIARVSPMESSRKRRRGRSDSNTKSYDGNNEKEDPQASQKKNTRTTTVTDDKESEVCTDKEHENTSENDTNNSEENPYKSVKNTNGYYEVDEILNRRIVERGTGHVVEYLVSWKTDYEPSWMIAENLDQNSLADAFRRFPMPADPDILDGDDNDESTSGGDESSENESDDDLDINDDSSVEEAAVELTFSQDGDQSDDNDSILDFDFDDNDIEEEPIEEGLKKDIAFLAESDYDKPGTAELVLNRKCYRVGQSYYEGGVVHESIILTICELIPRKRVAVCTQYMKIENTFTVAKGMEGRYIQTKDTRTVELSQLHKPCKYFKKCPTYQYEFDEKERSFAYFHNNGKIVDHFPKMKPKSLDLFAGAGGATMGFHNAGFESKWVVDNNQYAAATLQANIPQQDTTVYTEPVEKFLKKSRQECPGYPSVGEVDHIHASPPCKGFSRANICGGKDLWKNNQLSLHFVRAIKHFQPMTATFENVPGLLLPEYRHYLQGITSSLLAMKYQVRCAVLSASSYGDPQNRRRVILWAARHDCVLPAMPAPSHGPDLIPTRSVKDAIHYLEEHTASSSGSGTVVCDGVVLHNHLCSKARPSEDDFVAAPDRPARTILCHCRPSVHYKLKRYLSVREVACLQSFPPSYQFFGPMSEQYRQIGNAVPVRLATAVARSVAVVHGLP